MKKGCMGYSYRVVRYGDFRSAMVQEVRTSRQPAEFSYWP